MDIVLKSSYLGVAVDTVADEGLLILFAPVPNCTREMGSVAADAVPGENVGVQ